MPILGHLEVIFQHFTHLEVTNGYKCPNLIVEIYTTYRNLYKKSLGSEFYPTGEQTTLLYKSIAILG